MSVKWDIKQNALGLYEIQLFDKELDCIDRKPDSYTSYAQAAYYAPSIAKQYEIAPCLRDDRR